MVFSSYFKIDVFKSDKFELGLKRKDKKVDYFLIIILKWFLMFF